MFNDNATCLTYIDQWFSSIDSSVTCALSDDDVKKIKKKIKRISEIKGN